MNAKNDEWESYTDEVGRRHWRWPASGGQYGASQPVGESGTRHTFGLPQQQQQAQRAPMPFKGK